MTATKLARLCLALLAMGASALLVSLLIPVIVLNSSIWSEEDAKKYAHVASSLHQTLHGHEHDNATHPATSGPRTRSVQNAKAEWRVQSARLDARIVRREVATVLFRWIGIAFLVSGIAVYTIDRIQR